MLCRSAPAALALTALMTSSVSSYAMTGIGCPDLPAYARAQGTLQMGEGACNMTTAEAMRIVKRERPDLYGSASEPAAPLKHHRRATYR